MTPLLEQAIVKVTQLPSLQQDAIASLILEELLDELEWDNRFAESQNQLAKLAKKAREDHQAGRVRKMGMDEL